VRQGPGEARYPDIRTDTMTDIRLRQGGVGAQFWSVYVPASLAGRQASRHLEQIDIVHRMIARYPDDLELASPRRVQRIFLQGKIALLSAWKAATRSIPCRRPGMFARSARAT